MTWIALLEALVIAGLLAVLLPMLIYRHLELPGIPSLPGRSR